MRALKAFTLLVFAAVSMQAAGTFACTGQTSDVANGQTAINANYGGQLNFTGSCNNTTGQWQITQSIRLQGLGAAAGYTLVTGSMSNVLNIHGDNVTVDGFWFQHASVTANTTANGVNNNLHFTNNKITDLTNGGGDNCYPNCSAQPAFDTDNTGMVGFVFQFNQVLNIWGGGGYPYNPWTHTGATQQNQCQAGVLSQGTCILDNWGSQGLRMGGMDQSVITDNTFDMIGNDAIYLDWNAFTGVSGPHRTTTNNVIGDNEIKHIRRIPMEIQSQPSYPNCAPAGTCDGGVVNNNGLQVRGNYVHAYSYTYYQGYGCSCVPDGNLAGLFYNNTFVADQAIGAGNGMAAGWELSLNNGLFTGNVIASGSPGYNPAITGSGNSSQSFTTTVQNNVMCGNPAVAGAIGSDVGSTTNAKSAKYIDQWNYKNGNCPAGSNLNASSIATAWTSQDNQQFSSGANGSWALTVISNLSIRHVSFYIDGSSTPAFTQLQSGANTNFANDRKWPYSFSTGSTLGAGSHTISAVATDASGVNSPAIVQHFTVGTSTSPLVSFSGAAQNNAVAFGPQTVGAAAQLVFSITNPGGANLTFTIPTSPSGDFAWSTTCAALLSPGQSCNVTVTFTPSIGGARTGTFSLTDNATGSPHVVNFTGTGLTASACIPTPPNLIQPGVCDGSTYPNANTGFSAGGSASTLATAATGPGGSSALHLSIVGTPSGLEVTFNNLPLQPQTNYTATLNVKSNRPQVAHLLAIDQSTFAGYGLDVLPNLTTTATLLSYSFTTPATVTANNTRLALQFPNGTNTDTADITLLGITQGSAQSVTNLAVANVSHSQAQFTFNTSSSYTGLRVRISTNNCATGDTTGYGPTNPVVMEIGASPTTGASTVVGGLAPNTAYTGCTEVTQDGTNWSSGVSVPFTTLASPSVDPALPASTTRFNTDLPDTTGYVTYQNSAGQPQLLTDCSDFATAVQAATARLGTTGTFINVPVGQNCQAPTYQFSTLPPDAKTWTPSNVDINTSQITLGGPIPLTELQGVVFGRTNSAATAYPASTSCGPFGTGIVTGTTYYAHLVTPATNTIRLLCPDKTTLMAFTSPGSSTTGGYFWASLPRALKWIIVQSATPAGQLPPAKTQLTKDWINKLSGFIDPVVNVGSNDAAHSFFVFGSADPGFEPLISNIRIGPGIEITTADSPEAHTSSDPDAWFNLIVTRPFVSNVVFTQDYIHGKGTPNRITNGWQFDGSNIGMVDSYLDGLVYYHSECTGLPVTQTSTNTFTIGAGTCNMGQGQVTVTGPRTVTVQGNNVSGTIFAGLDMTALNIMTIWLPPGVTGSCSGNGACAISNTQFGTGDGSCGAGGKWKRDGQGQVVVGLVGCVALSGGNISSTEQADDRDSAAGSTEGSNFITSSFGPGPLEVKGNYFEGAGLTWLQGAAGGTASIRSSLNMERNYFKAPLTYMLGSATSDGLSYFHRWMVELQGIYGARIHGNVFDGGWSELTIPTFPSSVMLAMDAINGQGITDVSLRYNTFQHGPGVTTIPSIVPGSPFSPPPPTARFQAKDNLAWDIGNPYYTALNGTAPVPRGWLFAGPNGTEDWRIEHNTMLQVFGSTPAVLWFFDTNSHGGKITDNIFGIDNTTQGVGQDSAVPANPCTGLVGKLLLDCKGTPTYQWANNLMVPLSQTTAQLQVQWPTLPNYFQTGATGFTNVGFFNYAAPITQLGNTQAFDFHVNCSFSLCAGQAPATDYTAIGANIETLRAQQGHVVCCFLSPTANQVSYVAADSATCTDDLSTTPNDAAVVNIAVRVVDAGGQRQRTVTFTGLTPHQLYYGMTRCNGYSGFAQKPFSFFAQ